MAVPAYYTRGETVMYYAVRVFVAQGLRFFVATSFSKSFSLYGERVGCAGTQRRCTRGSDRRGDRAARGRQEEGRQRLHDG